MSRVIDMTGQKFNRLTVIKRAGSNNQGKALWECKCDCGNMTMVTGIQLRNSAIKSCGCLQREKTSKISYIDRTGEKIGNFTLLDFHPRTKEQPYPKWRYKCNLCGSEDNYATIDNLRKQYSCGCCSESKGERKIKALLKDNNIDFIQEKSFTDCLFNDTNRLARFDFYLPEKNIAIEYDGVQHFKQGNGCYDNQEKIQKTKEHDEIKNKYCKLNNICLIRIPYFHFDNLTIEDLLENSIYKA